MSDGTAFILFMFGLLVLGFVLGYIAGLATLRHMDNLEDFYDR